MGVCLGTYATEVEHDWDAFFAALTRVGASMLMAGSRHQELAISDADNSIVGLDPNHVDAE